MGLTLTSRLPVPGWAIAAALFALVVAVSTWLALDAALADLHVVEALGLEGRWTCD